MPVTFPNETPTYRSARNALLAEEIALRAKVAAVAELRRTLPDGGTVPRNYAFTGRDNARHLLSDLFGDRPTLGIYSFMYKDTPCPMCTSMLDGLNGQVRHFGQRMSFVVVAEAAAETLNDFARGRGWDHLTLLSSAGTGYQHDYHGETDDGAQLPILNVFRKSGEAIRHFWASEGFFADVDGHPRHVDQLWPLWNMLDLTPEGRGEDWFPSLA